MIIAAHQTMLAPKGGPSSLDYVQDGLYYQLDGIENAGRGVHDATASTWADLTGNGRNATFINGKTWKDDACYLASATSDHMAKIYSPPSFTSFTLEVAHRMYSREDYARLYENEAYFGNVSGRRIAFIFGPSIDPQGCSVMVGISLDNDYNLISPNDTNPRLFTVVPSVSSGRASAAVYVNGVYVQTVQNTTMTASTPPTYIDVANRSNSPNRGMNVDIYAIRCYSRVLTDAEIAANYAIDKARFNLP